MQTLKLIWADIRQGENIDLYVTVAIAVFLVVLNIVGIAPQSWIAPLTLAVLALLAIAAVGNRHKLESIRQLIGQTEKSPFLEEFPESLQNEIEQAHELWIVGTNLRRTMVTYYSMLEQKLKRGDTIRVLVMNPDGESIEISVSRSYRPVDAETGRSNIRQTLNELCTLKEMSPNNIEIRTLDYPLHFGGFVMSPDSSSGSIYLEHYAFKMSAWDSPKLILRHQDRHWYNFFKTQIQTMWDSGTPWEC